MAGYFGKISAQLDLDISPFERGLAASLHHTEKWTHGIEDRLVGPRHIATALATAFGINIEKIGQSFGRLWTGITEDAEKAYKEIETLSTEAADKQIEQMRRTLDGNKKLALLQTELDRLRRNGPMAEQREPGLGERILGATVGTMVGHMFGGSYLAVRDARLAENKANRDKANYETNIKALKLEEEISDIKEKQNKESEAFDERHAIAMETADQSLLDADRRALEIQKEQKKIAGEITEAKWKELDAVKALNEASEDRTASSLGDLAGSHSAPGRVQARQILQLESRAKRQRMSGVGDFMATQGKADALRSKLGVLSSSERNPLQAQQNAILKASQDILTAIDKKLSPISVGSGGAPTGNPSLQGVTSMLGTM